MSTRFDGAQFLSQLRDLEAGIRNNASQAMRSAMKAAEDEARSTKLYNDVSGALRKATTGTVDGLSGELRADTKYARYIEYGTPAHVIEARGGTLRFVMNGQVMFRRSVRHPGTAERPFMKHASDVGEKTLEYGVDYFSTYAIDKFNQGG